MTHDYVGAALTPAVAAGDTFVASDAFVAWPRLDDAALHGLAGEIVRTIGPHTEADPVAVLIQVLVFFGNVVGHAPHYRVEADNHHTNLYAVLVGQSSRGRKGTSGGRARSVMELADPTWVEDRMKGGLSSGEGLISEVRDPVENDPGEADKRLMVTEPEFVNALSVMERPGNTLSPVIRKAWDCQTLATMTKASPLKASGTHISIVGHITETELRASLSRTDVANGFANRFLVVCVKRSKLLPFGGALPDAAVQRLAEQVKAAVDVAKRIGRVTFTPAARTMWAAAYEDLSREQDGLLGAITARAEAQTIRLSLIYALLDGSDQIDVNHLAAGLAVWEYCEASAAHVFGNSLGDPVADDIERALRGAGAEGMTRTEIRDLFGRHRSSDRVAAALALLSSKGRARMEKRQGGGRPSEHWFATAAGRQ